MKRTIHARAGGGGGLHIILDSHLPPQPPPFIQLSACPLLEDSPFFEIVDLHATSPFIKPQTDDFLHVREFDSIFENVKNSTTPIPIFRGLPCALWLQSIAPVHFWVYGDVVPRLDQPSLRNCFHPRCSIQFKWKKSSNRFNGPRPLNEKALVGDRIYERIAVGCKSGAGARMLASVRQCPTTPPPPQLSSNHIKTSETYVFVKNYVASPGS